MIETLRLLSGNREKIRETTDILGAAGVRVVPIQAKLEEIQSSSLERIVHDKLLKAFARVGRPMMVEHTGLYLDALNGFPGGLTDHFWGAVGPARLTELFGGPADNKLHARTIVGFTDGRNVHKFEGLVHGTIPRSPRGNPSFEWDCVFVPDGYDQTFAEMGAAKSAISMRRLALDQLVLHLEVATL